VAELLERVAPSVPKPLARLIDSCLHTEPATRPTALEVVECLENIQSEPVPWTSWTPDHPASAAEEETLTFNPRLKDG